MPPLSTIVRRLWLLPGLLLPLLGRAQSAPTVPLLPAYSLDSLREVARQHPHDSAGAAARTWLAARLLTLDTAAARRYGEQALLQASALRLPRWQGRAAHYLGLAATAAGYSDRAAQYHRRSLAYFRQVPDSAFWVSCAYRALGGYYSRIGEPEAAMRLYLRSLHLREQLGDSVAMADTQVRLARLQTVQDNFDAARRLLLQVLPVWQRRGLRIQVADVYNRLGIVERNTGHFEEAKQYLRQAIGMVRGTPDSAYAADALMTLGVVYMHQKQWPRALPPLLRAERLYAAAPVTPAPVWADILTLIGETYLRNGHPEQTERYTTRAMRICRQARLREEEMDALEGLANLAEARGDFATAFRYQRRLWLLSDTLHAEAAARGLAEMQTKYDTEKKDARNRIQALRLREQSLLVRKRNAQLLAAGAALLLLLVAGWGLYRRRALRQQLELEQQRQLLERQRAAAVLEAEENERRRIGSDLHDGIGQLLSAAKLNLHALEKQLHAAQPGGLNGHQVLLDNAVSVVDESFREVRSISHNLMPNALIKRGLVQAVRDFLDKLPTGNGLRVEVEVFGMEQSRLDATVESVLFRVIQELVQNIVKHARASEVTVQLVQGDAELTVVVEDNGVGFDPAVLGPEAGIGLRNVQTRMAYLGGQAYFDAAPGRGTTVTLEVPLPASIS